MACKKCNCNDNGCAPTVYPKCILMDKAYPCLGITVGKTGKDLFDAIEAACATWGGGNLTFNNGLTKTGNVVQLGGALVKDTFVDLGTLYKLTLAGNFGANTVNGIVVDPNGNGPGNPGAGIGTRNLTSGDGAAINTAKAAGTDYFVTLESLSQVGTKEASISLQPTQAIMKYSDTGGGANYRKVILDVNGITLEGISINGGLPTKCSQTQIQQAHRVLATLNPLPITTDSNVYSLNGAGIGIARIDSTPVVGTIQDGTVITLHFLDPAPGLITHDLGGITQDAILLNGCIDWQPSQYDTLTLALVADSTGTIRRWNEIGRKQCYTGFEAWKVLDAAGTMLNGEPIPTLNGGSTAFIARLRHQDLTHVEIQFTGTVSVGVIAAITMFTLPATAGGIAYRPTAPLAYNITGMNTTTGVPYTGQLQITAGGAVNFTVQDVIPPGAAEDHTVAFIISIPLD